MSDHIRINDRSIGPGHPAFLIAEIAQAHDGSLGLAHAFVDAAADAGVDAVKFQTHIASAESTRQEQFRVRFSRQDASRYDYWRRMEFSAEQWRGLADHATERGLVFMSSAFSLPAIQLLAGLDLAVWKIASGEIASASLMDAILATGKPLIVSTGMSPWSEIDHTVQLLRARGASFSVMQCTSRYPTPLDKVGLNVLDEMRRRYQCPVGLSDHSGTPFPGLVALARGCNLLEAHLTLDRHMFGPDVSSSLTVEEFRLLVRARDAFVSMDAHPVDKDAVAQELAGMRGLFMRSAAPVRDLPAGTVLTKEMICGKKPGTGIPMDRIATLVGRRLARDVSCENLFSEQDFHN